MVWSGDHGEVYVVVHVSRTVADWLGAGVFQVMVSKFVRLCGGGHASSIQGATGFLFQLFSHCRGAVCKIPETKANKQRHAPPD